MRVRLGACKTSLSSLVILYYRFLQGDTSVKVLILYFGVDFFFLLFAAYVHFLYYLFRLRISCLLRNRCSLGLQNVFLVLYKVHVPNTILYCTWLQTHKADLRSYDISETKIKHTHLVNTLQFIHVRFISLHRLLILVQFTELIFQ